MKKKNLKSTLAPTGVNVIDLNIADEEGLRAGIGSLVASVRLAQEEEKAAKAGKSWEPPYWMLYDAFGLPADASTVPEGLPQQSILISGKSARLQALLESSRTRCVVLTDLNQRSMAAVSSATRAETLILRFGTYTSLEPLGELKNLRHLILEENGKLAQLEPLAQLPHLRTLSLRGLKRVSSLSVLRHLNHLTGLELKAGFRGGMPVPMHVDSVEPVAYLKELKLLRLEGVRVKSDDLTPILKLPRSAEIDLTPTNHPLEQLALIAAAFPRCEEEWTKPLLEYLPCKKCGKPKVLLAGRGTRALCSACDFKKLSAFFAEFRALIEAARM